VLRADVHEDDRTSTRTARIQTADRSERNTRTRPTIQARSNARVRHDYESNALIRERQIQQEWDDRNLQPAASLRPEPYRSNGVDPSNPAVLAGQLAYREWSDPAQLEKDLKAQPNLAAYSAPELEAMAMLAIEDPSVRPALREAVAETVEAADSLGDLPQTPGFQFLLSTQLVEVPPEETEGYMYSARAHLSQLVEEEVSRSFDRNLDGAEGDDEVDLAGERFRSDLVALAEQHPALIDGIDEAARQVAADNADRIQDRRRADDGFFSEINHAVTGGIRGAASALADFIAPDASSGGIAMGPGWLRSSTFGDLTEVGAGFSDQLHGSIEGTAFMITDPVGAAKAIAEVARHPSLLFAGYQQAYEEHGPNGVAGAIGFDMLSLVLSAMPSTGAFAPLGSTIVRGASRVLGGAIPDDEFLDALRKSDGFTALGAGDQATLLRWVDNKEPFISPQMRDVVERALRELDEFDDLPQAEREAALARLMESSIGYSTSSISSNPAHFTPNAEAVLSRAVDTDIELRTSVEPAVEQTVRIDGREIRIISAAGGDARNSVDEVVEALRSLPPASRNQIHTVFVEPAGHGGADATAAPDGNPVIVLYNNGRDPMSHDELVTTLIHESGHVMSEDRWGGTYRGPEWDRWREAMQSDQIRASPYARVKVAEDFAETFAIYHSVQGTPWEAAVRAKLPERFAILDELIAAEGDNSPLPPLR
jgi:hypothetical protein